MRPRARARDSITESTLEQRREKPVLFNDAMVQQVISGSKTQTRRPISLRTKVPATVDQCSYRRGDRLWVRETWCQYDPTDRSCVVYRADCTKAQLEEEREVRREMGCRTHLPWRPSIHMPRWASRITLEVTEVRAQRVQEISDEDIAAEGVSAYSGPMRLNGDLGRGFVSAHRIFAMLWDGLYGAHPDFAWQYNPWVWVLTFRVAEVKS